jgi:hypothetical protein
MPAQLRLGCNLITSSGYTVGAPLAAPKKKSSLLPLLTVVFIISYGFMTMLIVEQGATIQAQSNLIKVLIPDSRELWALKGKAIGSATPAPNHGQTPSTQTPSKQAPAVQAPSAQAPANQTPANQAPSKQVPQHRAENRAGKVSKPQVEAPPTPASDLLDQRRALNSI